MTFRDIIGRNEDDGGVAWHEHDAGDISGEAVFTDLKVDKLLGGKITGKEIVVAGGTDGILRSDNFVADTSGWQIVGDGSAEFNDVIVRGVLTAGTGSDVDWSYISNVSIETADIQNAAITTAKIANLAVTNAKIDSLTASKITSGTISAQTITIGTSGVIQGTSNAWQISESKATFGGGSHTITLDPSDYPSGQARFRTDHNGGYLVNGGVSYVWDYDPSQPYILLKRSSRSGDVVTDLVLLSIGPGLTVFGSIGANDGSPSSPAYQFRNDTDTGMYLAGTNSIGLAGDVTVTGQLKVNGDRITWSEFNDWIEYDPTGEQLRFVLNNATEFALGQDGLSIPNVYNATTGSAANVNVASDGTLARSTSSARYKTDIAPFAPTASVLDLTPSTFRPKDDPDRQLLGLIAEDVANYFPLASVPDDQGRPDAIDWNAIVSGLLAEVRTLRARVGALEAA